MNNRILREVNTQDFNDMRAMLTDLEQRLITVEPLKQMRFYQGVQARLYDMLEAALDENNILLYPETNLPPQNFN